MRSIARRVDDWRRAFGRGVFPAPFAWILELPWRRLVLSPELLVSRLALRPGSSVLELGAGSGYYSVAVAREPDVARLTLFDLQPAMLARCRRALANAGSADIALVVGDCAALPFADGTFDVVYMVTVLGEVHDRAACLRGIRRALKPDGLLSISEHLPDPDFVPLGALQCEAAAEGFALERWRGRSWAYTADLRPR